MNQEKPIYWSRAYPDSHLLVLPGPALTPDQNGLHLGGEALLPGDAQLQGEASVGGHASTFAVSDIKIFLEYRKYEFT